METGFSEMYGRRNDKYMKNNSSDTKKKSTTQTKKTTAASKKKSAAVSSGITVSAELLIFSIDEDKLQLLMIEREEKPYAGLLALPSVEVGIKENLDDAALRGITEVTGLDDIYYEQLYTFGDTGRDPSKRNISVSYMALVPIEKLAFRPGERVAGVWLVDVDDLLEGDDEIAFDHREMIEYARWYLADRTESTTIAFHLVDDMFTLPDLQRVYEIILGRSLYKANFRKKVAGLIEETEYLTTGEAHRPSRLYVLAEE